MESIANAVPASWKSAVADAVSAAPFQDFANELAVAWARPYPRVYPKPGQVFRALELTPLDSVRAVILGQDPYPTEGMAMGLAFSAPDDRNRPQSLRKIFAARDGDLGLSPPTGNSLERWATNGVLLLNTALTVEHGGTTNHRKAWAGFTEAVIDAVNELPSTVVFLLWGGDARAVGRRMMLSTRHVVVESLHPAARPHRTEPAFIKSHPFRRAAECLRSRDLPALEWSLPGDS